MAKSKNQNYKLKSQDKDVKFVVIGIILVLVAFLLVGLYTKINYDRDLKKNADLEDPLSQSFYSEDSCRCVERERLKCPEGYELNSEGRFCSNGESFTNVVLGCSAYECSGVIYSFNFENRTWQQTEE